MASESQTLTVREQGLRRERNLLRRLSLEKHKPLLLGAHALASIVLLAWIGVTDLSLPLLAGLLALAADMQILFLRIRLDSRTDADDAHEQAIGAMQRQVDQTRSTVSDGPVALHQRWFMEWRLRQECARCRRYGLSLAVVVVKIEGLDGLPGEDWLPHAARAAQITAAAVRNVDMASEIGPGEFALSLVHCDEAGAEAAMGRLAKELKGYELQMGCAVFPVDDVAPAALVDLARARIEPWDRAEGPTQHLA